MKLARRLAEAAVDGRELGCDWYGVTEADVKPAICRLALTSTRLPELGCDCCCMCDGWSRRWTCCCSGERLGCSLSSSPASLYPSRLLMHSRLRLCAGECCSSAYGCREAEWGEAEEDALLRPLTWR